MPELEAAEHFTPRSLKPRRRSCFLTSPPATARELSIAGAARALTCCNGRTDENPAGAAAAPPSCSRRLAPEPCRPR